MTSASNRRKERFRRIKKAATAAVFARGVNVLSGVITIPLTLPYLGDEQFAIWMVLTGYIAFLSIADMGFGIGLQHKLTQCDGRGDTASVKPLISTALFLMVLICVLFCLIGIYVLPSIDLTTFIKLETEDAKEALLPTAQAMFVVFGLSLPLGLAQRIFDAYQNGYISNILLGIGRMFGLLSIVGCVMFELPLQIMAALYLLIPYLFLSTGIIYQFWQKTWMRPHIKCIDIGCSKIISRIGVKAFSAQLGAVIMSTGPLLVLSSQFGATEIVPFSVAQRLLGISGILLTVMMAPLWPAYGEAKERNDFLWVKSTFYKSLWVSTAVAVPIFIFFSIWGQFLIEWWAGESAVPDWSLLMACNVWALLMSWIRSNAMLLNGLGYFKWQAVYGLILPVVAVSVGYHSASVLAISLTVWVMIIFGDFCRFLLMAIETRSVISSLIKPDLKNGLRKYT